MSLLTMMTTSEEATQKKSMTRPSRSVHHASFFLWALCQEELVRSMTQRFVAASGAGLPFCEISASSPRASRRSRVAFES